MPASQPQPGLPRESDDAGFDAMRYVVVLWRRRWILMAVVMLSGITAFTTGRLSPLVYEASSTLLVSPPKTALPGEQVPAVTVATFRALLDNQSLAQQVVREFKLDAPPLSIGAVAFRRSHLGLDNARESSLVVLKVRLPSRDLPAKVANRLAELAISLAERLSQEETVRAQQAIKAQLDLSYAEVERAETRLLNFRRESQLEALKKDVEAQLGQRENLLPLLVSIQTEKAKLRQAEAELAKRKRIQTLRRTIDNSAIATEAARASGVSGPGLLSLELRDESLDTVYERIDTDVAATRTRLSGLERQKEELVDVLHLDSVQLQLLDRLYTREAALGRLETERDLAKEIYISVATRYQQIRVQVAGRTAQLQLADTALVPDRPVGPRVMRNTAVAMFLAFGFAVLGLIGLELVGDASRRAQAEQPRRLAN